MVESARPRRRPEQRPRGYCWAAHRTPQAWLGSSGPVPGGLISRVFCCTVPAAQDLRGQGERTGSHAEHGYHARQPFSRSRPSFVPAVPVLPASALFSVPRSVHLELPGAPGAKLEPQNLHAASTTGCKWIGRTIVAPNRTLNLSVTARRRVVLHRQRRPPVQRCAVGRDQDIAVASLAPDRHRPAASHAAGVLEVDPEPDREQRNRSERQFQNCRRGESYGARAVRCG